MAIVSAKRFEHMNFQVKIFHRHHFPQAFKKADIAHISRNSRHFSLRFIPQHHGDYLSAPAHGSFHQVAMHLLKTGTVGCCSFRKHQKISAFIQGLGHGLRGIDQRTTVAALNKNRIHRLGNHAEHGPTRNLSFGYERGRKYAVERKNIQKRNMVGHYQATDLAGRASAVPDASISSVLTENVHFDAEPTQDTSRPTPNDAPFPFGS